MPAMSGGGMSGGGRSGGGRGSGFVGLNAYLNANRGAGQAMGNQLASGVEQQGAEARGAIDRAADAFDQGVAGGTSHYYSGLSLQDTIPAFNAAAYTGPTEFQPGNLGAQAQTAQQQAQMLQTDAGRAALLRMQHPEVGYTQGASMLDAALAGRGAADRIAQAGAGYGKLQGYLTGVQQQAADKVKAAKDQSTSVREHYGKDLGPLPSGAPTPPPAPTAPPSRVGMPMQDPRATNARQIADENKWKAQRGIRG